MHPQGRGEDSQGREGQDFLGADLHLGIGPQTHRELQEVMRTKCRHPVPLPGLKWPGCLPGLGCLGPAAECHSSWPRGSSQGHWLPQQKRGPGGGKVCDTVPVTPTARLRGMDRARQHQLPPSHLSQSRLKANPGGHVPFS